MTQKLMFVFNTIKQENYLLKTDDLISSYSLIHRDTTKHLNNNGAALMFTKGGNSGEKRHEYLKYLHVYVYSLNSAPSLLITKAESPY